MVGLEKAIKQIQDKIRKETLNNEAAVSQGVVLPLLSALGWPVFNTQIVSPEYVLEGRRVDYALLNPHNNKAKAFIEVKGVGKSVGAEKQLFEYAFHRGVQLAILTDGLEWSFFLPLEQGDYDERRFYKLDIIEHDLKESAYRLNRYLNYDAVNSNDAIKFARDDYKDLLRRKVIKN